MKFPNAAKGVKKIHTAEILALISSIFLMVGVIMLIIGAASFSQSGVTAGNLTSVGSAAIFLIVFFVLMVIAFIMNLVGLINASREESSFKSALIFLIISIAATCVAFFGISSTLTNIMYSVSNLMDIFVTIFVIAGVVKLADRLNRGDISSKGTGILKLILIIGALSFIASFITSFLGSITASVVAGIILLVAVVLNIIKYFMYLSFLSQAKKMLLKA